MTVGLSSVSRPVLDHTGHPVAAVAVTFEGARVDEPARLALVRAVGQAAEALAHRLGRLATSLRRHRAAALGQRVCGSEAGEYVRRGAAAAGWAGG